jgi:hypothetical protein
MSAFEALMWRAEADPRLRSTICGLELLDCVPDWQRFVAAGEWATDGLAFFAPALARLPMPLISRLAGGLTKTNDLQASNVPGFREDVYIAGARIERLYGFGPLPGCAAMITLVTHGDTCCIAANVDPEAITDLDRFGRCLEKGFAEVLALHPGAEPARRRI